MNENKAIFHLYPTFHASQKPINSDKFKHILQNKLKSHILN